MAGIAILTTAVIVKAVIELKQKEPVQIEEVALPEQSEQLNQPEVVDQSAENNSSEKADVDSLPSTNSQPGNKDPKDMKTTDNHKINQFGSISGWLCYPSEDIPPMTIYARDIETQKTFSIHVAKDNKYKIKVPTGNFIVFAWTDVCVITPDSKGGIYSCYSKELSKQSYPDKNFQGCKDPSGHEPIVVSVKANNNVADINICDFLADNITNP